MSTAYEEPSHLKLKLIVTSHVSVELERNQILTECKVELIKYF